MLSRLWKWPGNRDNKCGPWTSSSTFPGSLLDMLSHRSCWTIDGIMLKSYSCLSLNQKRKNQNIKMPWRLPCWLCGEEPTCRCRRRQLDPWSSKIPRAESRWALEPQLLRRGARKPQLLSPRAAPARARAPRAHAPQQDEPLHGQAHALRLEKTPARHS